MLDSFIEDKGLQNNGSWVYVEEMGFKLRRTGTPEANRELEKIKHLLFGVDYSEIALTEEQRSEANVYFLVNWVITDWCDVKMSEGDEEIEYSKPNAYTYLYKEKGCWNSLCAYLLLRSADYTNFLSKLLEKDKEEIKKP